ncbi:E3 ubiquitin-protein ligase BAH1-like [Actinidia chinensis var. chinensis]|uniref:E3 ubiquitin-protein ligase BAH1-like n=1 Tax=Actinidia chinensis var. chinensis TaxID=1590841 RepID=A0A2R6Q459_ACTCC|nr:E3 ubiquitin-protein ligase BAH1-like [Actinidia chinensis var. chinensis]
MVQKGKMMIEYVAMNAIATRKILKKYNKVHSSVNGRKFKSKMRAEHTEILQSPWLIELGAFYMNSNEPAGGDSAKSFCPFSCDLNAMVPVMTLMLPDSYALSCGHLFCKSCACSAVAVMIFEGPKAANPESKCPVCRETGVYGDAVHMLELDLFLEKRERKHIKAFIFLFPSEKHTSDS